MSGHGNGRPGGQEQPPRLPYELTLNSSWTHFQPRDDDGMVLVFTPGAQTPAGVMFAPPQVRIQFSADGWERFKQTVAADGAASPIAIARMLPPDLGAGG